MQRRTLVMSVLVASMLVTLASAQVRTDALGRVGLAAGDGRAVAALVPVGSASGWGRVEVSGLGIEPDMEVEGSLFSLQPWHSYALLVDGENVLGLRTNRFGDADFEAAIFARTDAGATTATVVDSSQAVVLEGTFVAAGQGGDDAPIAYEDRIDLDDILGVGADGMARVERRTDDAQAFSSGATGLQPGETYQVVVDGVLAAVVTADQVGQARVCLASPDGENPLPPELQPIDDLRLVQWFDGNDDLVLSGAFSGNSPTPALLFGTVESVAETSFVVRPLEPLGEAVTVLVDESTQWGGTVSGIGDLEAGMFVTVEGELTADGSVQAWFVANEEGPPPEPVFLIGTVESVAEASFVLVPLDGMGDRLTVLVDESTQWGGTLSGIADLEAGMLVTVEGELTSEGSLQARFVANEDAPPPPPVFLMGTVRSVAEASFVLVPLDGMGEPVTVVVDEATQWDGGLTGINDLEIGMSVLVDGELTPEGNVHAWFVAAEEGPPGFELEVLGTVESVGETSFLLATGPAHGDLVTVFVNEGTVWGGSLSGIGDLSSGMMVYVQGELTPEQTVLAWFVESWE